MLPLCAGGGLSGGRSAGRASAVLEEFVELRGKGTAGRPVAALHPNTEARGMQCGYAQLETCNLEVGGVAVQMKKPWEYVSRDMNWSGAIVGLAILALLIADLAVLGSTLSGYIGVAVIVVVSGTSLRLTAHRRAHRSH